MAHKKLKVVRIIFQALRYINIIYNISQNLLECESQMLC